MHHRRFFTFLVGLWLGGTLLIRWVEDQNFAMIGRVLTAQPQQMQQIIFTLTDIEKKNLFRYVASEMNRFYSGNWEWIQLGLGVILMVGIVLAKEPRQYLIMAACMTLAVLACHFLLTPQLIGIGRMIDFLPLDQSLDERKRFASLGIFYLIVDILKFGAGVAMLVQWLRRGPSEKRKRRSVKLDEIPYPNYN